MDNVTLAAMSNTLSGVKDRTIKVEDELGRANYRNALLLLMSMILDLSNVAYDLDHYLLYTPRFPSGE